MSCPHDWQPAKPGSFVHICTRCAATTYDPSPPVRISDAQAAALFLARNGHGLLELTP